MNTLIRTSFFFSLVLVFLTSEAPAQDSWGNFKGKIKVTGEVPPIDAEKINKDVATCLADKKPPKDDNLIVNKEGGIRDVFVMMYLKKEEPPVHPMYEELKKKPVELDNKDCRFTPHALFVRTGQTLRLKNSDDVGHNCHIKCFNNEHNVNVPQDKDVDLSMAEKEKVPGLVVCDIHPWMDAVIMIRDEPYVAITDKDGSFEIKNVPAGEWKFQFWHRKCGYMKKLEVPGSEVGRRGEIEVKIEADKTLDLGVLTIDGSAFEKKNKK